MPIHPGGMGVDHGSLHTDWTPPFSGISALLGDCWRLYLGNIGTVMPFVLILSVIDFAINLGFDIAEKAAGEGLMSILWVLLHITVTLGIYAVECGALVHFYIHKKTGGSEPDLTGLFQWGIVRFGAVFPATIGMSIRIILWLLLLIVPGVIKLIDYTFVTVIAAIEGRHSAAQFEESRAIAQGNRMSIFGLIILSMALPLLIGILFWGSQEQFAVDFVTSIISDLVASYFLLVYVGLYFLFRKHRGF